MVLPLGELPAGRAVRTPAAAATGGGRHLALRVGELLRLELQIDLTAPAGRALAVQTLPQTAQAVQRLPARLRRPRHVALPELAGRTLHPLDRIAHGPRGRLPLLLPRVARLAGLRQRAAEILGPPPDLLLLARQPLEAPPALSGIRRRLARQLLLLPVQGSLPLGEGAQPAPDLVFLAGLVGGLGRRAMLVVRLLVTPQVAVEERRQVFPRTHAAARSPPAPLLRHLGRAHAGLRPEQLVERRHLRRNRGRRPQPAQLGLGRRHRIDGEAERVAARRASGVHLRHRPPQARRKLLGRELQIALRVRHRLDVVAGTRSRRLAVQLPGGDDDLLLHVGEPPQILRLGGRVALARGLLELPVEGAHLEEVDVAADRGAAARLRIPRAHVIGEEVAGLQLQVLAEDRVGSGRPGDARRSAQAHDPLRPPHHAVHQLEAREPEIVDGARLDGDLLEGRDLPIPRGAQDLDGRRPVLHGPDEVVAAARVGQTVRVAQPHAVGVVREHVERGRQHAVDCLQREARAGAQLQPAVVDRLARAHGNGHAGAGRGVDVAPVGLDARRQPHMRRILVRHLDAAHARREDGRDRVLVRRQRRRLHAVGEAGIDRRHVELVGASRVAVIWQGARRAVAGGHGHDRQGSRGPADAGPQDGPQSQRPAGDDARVARLDLQLRPVRKRVEPRRPRDAAERTAAEHDDQQQRRDRQTGRRDSQQHVPPRQHPVEVDGPRGTRRVAQEQVAEKRRAGRRRDVRGADQALLQRRTPLLDVARHLPVAGAATEPPQRAPGQARGQAQGGGEQPDHHPVRRLQRAIGEQDEQEQTGCRGGDPAGRQHRAPGQPAPAHPRQERTEVVERGLLHGRPSPSSRALHSVTPCHAALRPSQDSATSTTATASRRYHQ